MPKPLRKLGELCMTHDPSERPTFNLIVRALMKLETRMREVSASSPVALGLQQQVRNGGGGEGGGVGGGGGGAGGGGSIRAAACCSATLTAATLHPSGRSSRTQHSISTGVA